MEVLRTGVGVHDASFANGAGGGASQGYASTYRRFNFPDLLQDREELLNFALDRLDALKEVHAQIQRKLKPDDLQQAVRAVEKKYMLSIPGKAEDRMDRIYKDECSHFLLRAALSRSRDQKEFLLRSESQLLSSRLSQAGSDAVLSVLEENGGSHVEAPSREELQQVEMDLDAVGRGPRRYNPPADVPHYKVPFELLPSHLASRRVFLRNGIAFIPEPYLVDVLVAQFRTSLSQSLAEISKAIPYVESDSRYGPLLAEIRYHYTAIAMDPRLRAGLSSTKGDLSLVELEGPGLPAGMPLCMANLLAKLREAHHLKHGGRMQLGLFLKSCGLSMEASLSFWRKEFGKGTIASDRFDKQYAYSIRHFYGREGKRQELSCYGCMKVINSQPSAGEHHGCPYREFSENRLKSTLASVGVPPTAIASIADRAKAGHYQVACGMTFSAAEGVGDEADGLVVTNPAEYFLKARELRQQRSEASQRTQ